MMALQSEKLEEIMAEIRSHKSTALTSLDPEQAMPNICRFVCLSLCSLITILHTHLVLLWEHHPKNVLPDPVRTNEHTRDSHSGARHLTFCQDKVAFVKIGMLNLVPVAADALLMEKCIL